MSKGPFPEGIQNSFNFTVFNAFSYQMILGSPMVLFARSLGASATVLGIIAGMMPMLVIFQIPAAKHVVRVGYKRFVLAGWSTRVLFIVAMALVPLSGGFLDPATRLVLILFLLFGFNLSRGISSCAWLPWITSLIPETVRGRFLARDAAYLNVASFLVFLLAGWILGAKAGATQFALLFAFSAVAGGLSLYFLNRIPEGESLQAARTSNEAVPWKAIAAYPPFRRLVAMNMAWSVAYGGLNTFVVAYLKTEAQLGEREIMLISSIAFIGALSSLWFLGTGLDRLGSKPVLALSMLAWIVILLTWVCLSGRLLVPEPGLLWVLQFVMGLAASLVNLANTRLAMATIPVMGRAHFFALYSVVSNLTLGLAPVFWGLLLDGLGRHHWAWGNFEWNRFSVFFSAVALVYLVVLLLCQRLHEPKAATMEVLLREVLREAPLRVWLRFWSRLS